MTLDKFFNKNILKSMVFASLILCLLGLSIGFAVSYFTRFEFNSNLVALNNIYLQICLGLLALIYLAQVFFLQKDSPKDNNINTNIFTLLALLYFLLNTKFGTIGFISHGINFFNLKFGVSEESLTFMEKFFSINGGAVTLFFLLLMALVFKSILKPGNNDVLALIVITAIYTSFIGAYTISYEFVFLYVFAMYLEIRNKGFIIIQPKGEKGVAPEDRHSEILFLAVTSLAGFVAYLVMFILSVFLAINEDQLGPMTTLPKQLLLIVCGVLFLYAWKRNSLKLLVSGFIVYIASFLANSIYYLITISKYWTQDSTTSIWSNLLKSGSLDGLYGFFASATFILSIVAIVKLKKPKENNKPSPEIATGTMKKKFITGVVVLSLSLLIYLINAFVSFVPYLNYQNDIEDYSETGVEIDYYEQVDDDDLYIEE